MIKELMKILKVKKLPWPAWTIIAQYGFLHPGSSYKLYITLSVP